MFPLCRLYNEVEGLPFGTSCQVTITRGRNYYNIYISLVSYSKFCVSKISPIECLVNRSWFEKSCLLWPAKKMCMFLKWSSAPNYPSSWTEKNSITWKCDFRLWINVMLVNLLRSCLFNYRVQITVGDMQGAPFSYPLLIFHYELSLFLTFHCCSIQKWRFSSYQHCL